jgi:hypothetical protein
MSSIEEIKFSPTLSIWKSEFDITNKEKIISECENLIKSKPKVTNDGYSYYITNSLKYNGTIDINMINELDKVLYSGIESSINIYGQPFNEIKMDSWVNIVRTKNPVQKNYKPNGALMFHNHVDLNILNKLPPPLYTFVCYIQMPNNLSNNDAVLFMEDVDKKVFSILPKEGDVLIMKGDLPHVPNYAPNSTIDRIVLAGSIRMDSSKLNKSLI